MYGTQTGTVASWSNNWFENDVKMYGTQTVPDDYETRRLFENDVKMYGTQTRLPAGNNSRCLRMM